MRASFPLPRVWTNQGLTLYHGTVDTQVLSLRAGVRVSLGRVHTDFGQGFYTTTDVRQARVWAWAIFQRRRRTQAGVRAAVVRFDVDRDTLAGLDVAWFVRGTPDAEDFWSLVNHCRTGGVAHGRGTASGWYDVVVGPVSLSSVQRLLKADTDQVSFHTAKAARILDASLTGAMVLDAGLWRNLP